MEKIALFVLLAIFSFQAFAQHKPKATKFDEFSDPNWVSVYPYTKHEYNLENRIQRFTKEIRRNPAASAYIIYYRAQQMNEADSLSNYVIQTETAIRNIKGFPEQNVVTVDGGFREADTVEYWIVSRGAEPPKPTPTVDKTDTFSCPSVAVYTDGFYFDRTKPITFKAFVTDGFDVRYKWSVSQGKILTGQGSPRITVDISKADTDRISAFVELDGVRPTCTKGALVNAVIGPRPYLFDFTNRYIYSDLSARIDSFMIALNNNPELTGCIIAYAGRANGRVEIDRAVASIRRTFAFRRYSYDRVKVIDGGYREYNSVDMWLLPPGVAAPNPTPTVDSKFIKVSKKRVRFEGD